MNVSITSGFDFEALTTVVPFRLDPLETDSMKERKKRGEKIIIQPPVRKVKIQPPLF